MIKRIEIINLFGVKGNNKDIDFNEDLTILVGTEPWGQDMWFQMQGRIPTFIQAAQNSLEFSISSKYFKISFHYQSIVIKYR